MSGRHWSEDELIYLEYFVFDNDAQLDEAAKHLNRSLRAVTKKLWQLRKQDGDVQYVHRLWTKKEEDFLKRYYTTMTNKNIAKRLNRTVAAVEFRAKKIGLSKNRNIRDLDSEIRKLIAEGYYLSQICKELNIKMQSLLAHVGREGIEYKKMPRKEHSGYGNHIWNQRDYARYQEYLSTKVSK
jgi:hypothetical protein